ncbi:EFR1 family ferrodoxin [Vallitalea maricola]|uniref:EFR1 family ferrodoxin n=1 Tax=Vallitalea maricola TaxID=3074433 RepID=A0ACB5UQ29_9FIRM|nr:EFR1 family ferrodoxin [Vallitalea sp. AN17-2]
MSIKICYFSGTGNSFFIAKRLNEYLANSELIPIVKALKDSKKEIEGQKIIIVFPIYALTIPIPVRMFLKETNFKNATYFCAIGTRLGVKFNDFKRIDKLIKPHKLNSSFIINMGSNDVKVKNYKCPSDLKIKELEDVALSQLSEITRIIENNEDSCDEDSNYIESLLYKDFRGKIIEWAVPKMMTFSKYIGGVNYFYVNTNCIGCGICSKVCLSQKISIHNKKPIWNKKTLCYMCYACVNYCPVKAIEIESIPGVPSYTFENDRYCHPYAKYEEIENQK